MASKTCNDPNPHKPHTWYEPSRTGTTQTPHQCPGRK